MKPFVKLSRCIASCTSGFIVIGNCSVLLEALPPTWTFLPAMDEDIRFHLFSAPAKWYTENVNEQT